MVQVLLRLRLLLQVLRVVARAGAVVPTNLIIFMRGVALLPAGSPTRTPTYSAPVTGRVRDCAALLAAHAAGAAPSLAPVTSRTIVRMRTVVTTILPMLFIRAHHRGLLFQLAGLPMIFIRATHRGLLFQLAGLRVLQPFVLLPHISNIFRAIFVVLRHAAPTTSPPSRRRSAPCASTSLRVSLLDAPVRVRGTSLQLLVPALRMTVSVLRVLHVVLSSLSVAVVASVVTLVASGVVVRGALFLVHRRLIVRARADERAVVEHVLSELALRRTDLHLPIRRDDGLDLAQVLQSF